MKLFIKSLILKSFTLIELLIVIVIIGILATSLIPRLTGTQDRARIVSIKALLREIHTQAVMYHINNGESYAGLCNGTNTTIHASIQPMINSLKSIAGDTRVRCIVRTSDVSNNEEGVYYYAADEQYRKNFAVAVQFKGIHYAVDTFGVVTVDQSDQNSGTSTNRTTAMSRCASIGKKLPSVEILRAVRDTYGTYGSSASPDFSSSVYRSSTESPSHSTMAYAQLFTISTSIAAYPKINGNRVRCVE